MTPLALLTMLTLLILLKQSGTTLGSVTINLKNVTNPYGKIPGLFLRLAFEAVTFVSIYMCVYNKKILLKYFDMVVV